MREYNKFQKEIFFHLNIKKNKILNKSITINIYNKIFIIIIQIFIKILIDIL